MGNSTHMAKLMIASTQMHVSTNKSVRNGFSCDWPSSSEAMIGSGLTQVFVQSLFHNVKAQYTVHAKRDTDSVNGKK